MPDSAKHPGLCWWLSITVISLLLWGVVAQNSWARLVLVVVLSLGALMVGAIVGFLFTTYGEETGSVGKVRDWLIGGIAGLTIASFGSVKGLLLTFAAGPGPAEFALTASLAVIFAILGFFLMFFGRELIFNIRLAERRAERGRVEGTRQAGVVTQRLLLALPASVLSGIDDIDEILEKRPIYADELRKLLYSDDVSNFFRLAEEDLQAGRQLDWDVVSKVAVLQHYRIYWEPDNNKAAQAERAREWILRALAMNPLHCELTLKLVDTLAIMRSYSEAVAILERIAPTPEAPAFVKQWLGYYLLFLPKHVDDAIRYSEEYHAQFPDETDSFFNLACAYAIKYGLKEKAGDKEGALSLKEKAFVNLREGLDAQPGHAVIVRTEWCKRGHFFECLSREPELNATLKECVEQETVV